MEKLLLHLVLMGNSAQDTNTLLSTQFTYTKIFVEKEYQS